MDDTRFDRSIRFFGRAGQDELRRSRVGIVGVGGLGTHVVQQLALLGVEELVVIDAEELDDTNRNRYIGARHDDPVPGTRKVDIAERIALSIDPRMNVTKVAFTLTSRDALEALANVTHVFGCLDHDALRLVLTDVSAAYRLPYVDCASEILPGNPPEFGGRVCVAWSGAGCLSCLDELDPHESQDASVRRDRATIYGVPLADAGATPSVVSLNGIIASIAVTEFMVSVTGIRNPWPLLTYYGSSGTVRVRSNTKPGCYYCRAVRVAGDRSSVFRHVSVTS
jgi:molybdopterin/thiamine biosynthesis adenylyltransferase